ncbi:AsnC family transcriptional regulator [Halosegnis longus]|uniref:AsnC family transcriptional regulator n=1 Tax=Halosegnis longus TaxID=2216012 RepID=A0AAJ4UVL7_9EURY|nr:MULTISPECIES: AsnC family transcriptional regulator [Halobacteriales]RNJ26137.1 AsnC family transcriptional regulator [Salella cibi]
MPLDETDFEILSLLAADARRPYSDIGDVVDLSGPAVSQRVTRLRESGVIDGFTVSLNRDQLRAGVGVLVTVPNPGDVDALRDRLAAADGVEGVFTAVDGTVRFTGRTAADDVRSWVSELVASDSFDVELLDSVAWEPSVAGGGFAVACAECSNTVDSEGESIRLDGETYHFCCSSCRARFEERYERLSE